jgi:hypothetical protein
VAEQAGDSPPRRLPDDTAEYLRYRMKRAGCDRLATGCLREAARRKRKLVERDLLPRVLDRDGLERDG